MRGQCIFGKKCKFSHDLDPASSEAPREPCQYLGTSRGCFRGQQCKFSHDVAAGNDVNTQPRPSTSNSGPRTEFENGFREWTFLIPKQNTRFQHVETEKFFRKGWDLINKEHTETGQQVIRKLASEEGLAMIKALTTEQAEGLELATSK